MEILLTPGFFGKHLNAWSPTKAEPNHYVSLAFNAVAYGGAPWSGHYTFAGTENEPSAEPPNIIFLLSDSDDVSLLNDDPDEDDDQLLPSSTYDVLAPLLDEMYKDESEVDDAEQVTDELADSVSWNEEDVFVDGACAA